MPNYTTLDLRGKYPKDTYQYIVQASGSVIANGFGDSISALYLTSSFSENGLNCSQSAYSTQSLFATSSLSASYMTGSNFKIVGNELRILGTSGSWFMINALESTLGTGSLQLTFRS